MRAEAIRFGPAGRYSVRLRPRPAVVALAALALALAVGFASLVIGDLDTSPADVLGALTTSRGLPTAELAVELRLPRVLCALLGGAAFGVGGAVLQGIARNPLASPDVIGVSQGASLAAVLVLSAGVVAQGIISLAALVGGVAAAVAVYLIAWRGGVRGDRLVLTGIGLAAALAAVTGFVLIRADIDLVARTSVWLVGSLAFVGWSQAIALAVTVPAIFLVTLSMGSSLRQIELGDDLARSLGLRLERMRLALLAAGAAAVAVATAVCGPILFVALAAPQIARRVSGEPGSSLASSAAIGALIVVASDLIAREVFSPVSLPVGVVTAALGAPFMLWLINREARAEAADA